MKSDDVQRMIDLRILNQSMNKRLNELMIEAGYAYPEGATRAHKLAELIVRDCLDIAFEVRGKPATDTHYVIGYDRACEKIIDAIKESFGVEE